MLSKSDGDKRADDFGKVQLCLRNSRFDFNYKGPMFNLPLIPWLVKRIIFY